MRVGNAAAMQNQHDVYGSVVLAATQMFVDERLPRMGDEALFRRLEPSRRAGGEAGVDAGCRHLGISRASADTHLFRRAVLGGLRPALADRGRASEYRRARAVLGRARRTALREPILARAWNQAKGALTGALDDEELDASVLLLAELGLLAAAAIRGSSPPARRSGASCAQWPDHALRQR